MWREPHTRPSLSEFPCRYCQSYGHCSVDHSDPDKPMCVTLAKIRMLPQCPEPTYKDAA